MLCMSLPLGEVAKRSFAYEFGCAKRVLLSKPKALIGLGFGAFRADALALDFMRAGNKAGNNRAPIQLSYSRLILARIKKKYFACSLAKPYTSPI